MIFVGDDKADGTKKLKRLPLQYCATCYIIPNGRAVKQTFPSHPWRCEGKSLYTGIEHVFAILALLRSLLADSQKIMFDLLLQILQIPVFDIILLLMI